MILLTQALATWAEITRASSWSGYTSLLDPKGVVLGVYRFVTSYDPPAFQPPAFRQPHTDLPIVTSLVLEGCASGILQTPAANLPTNWVSGSSLPCARPSSGAAVGLGRELAMKLSSNFLGRWSKDEMEDGFSQPYHIRASPMRVVGKARHIKA
ncbi:hypothetical protein GW17_00026486 [Ensete ventricosum]|nr:hypothetical protein GW17_00026486 [Ensete ventricosum]